MQVATVDLRDLAGGGVALRAPGEVPREPTMTAGELHQQPIDAIRLTRT